ncbi:hypothetical protein [Capsulimonas corticalis]|uniref:hypothetical protein n=1 Tax=Capsulimonas corticalis TaxID=2219043 RepID=UPI000E64DA39|nr:hypothetical protein [Capsulimonas corticalis]
MSFFRAHRQLCLVWGLLWSLVVLSASSGFCFSHGPAQTHARAVCASGSGRANSGGGAPPMGAMPANCPMCHGKMGGMSMKCCPMMAGRRPGGAVMKCMCMSSAPPSNIAALITSQEFWPPMILPAHVYAPRFSSTSLPASRRGDAVLTRSVSPFEKPPCLAALLGFIPHAVVIFDITRSFFSCIPSPIGVASR